MKHVSTPERLLGRVQQGSGPAQTEEIEFVGGTWDPVAKTLTVSGSSYTDEEAQDAVGTILTDTATIDFTYTDATPTITADVKNDSITYAKMQDVSAASRLLGRGSASGSGDTQELTVVSPIAISGTTLTTSMATNKLIGRGTASTGVMEEITLGTNLSLSGTTLNASGGGMSIGGTVTSGTADSVLFVGSGPVLAQDNANFFWDNTLKQLNVGIGAILWGNSHSNIFLTDLGKPSGLIFAGTDSNTAMGSGALQGLTSGDNNSVFGSFAGLAITSGFENTLVGTGADCTATGHNQTSLGKGATCTASDQITLGDSTVGTLRCQQTSITALSDRRDKTDIADLPLGLDFVNSLRPVSFTWKSRDGSQVGVKDCGFIAQELQAVDTDHARLVYSTNPDRLEATPGRLIPMLTKAIQELTEQNRALATRVAALEG